MKKILLLTAICICTIVASAQKETFDLISYAAPTSTAAKSWKKEVAETVTSYTITNTKNSAWCRINIIKSTVSKGSIEKDFESEWQELIVKNYKPNDKPQIDGNPEAGDWKLKSGSAKFTFDKKEAAAILITATGFTRCASIAIVTNSQEYLKDAEALIASVDLKKPETISSPTPTANADKNPILGTWCISASDQSSFRVNNGVVSTIFRQYAFGTNGSYTCNIKTFDPLMSSILLEREHGSYQINGSILTINPAKSVLEEWSKKNGRDDWGKLLKTQNIQLEKVTYTFSKTYILENNEWQLILKAGNQTRRDGPFNNYDRNAWIYIAASPARPIIKLPN